MHIDVLPCVSMTLQLTNRQNAYKLNDVRCPTKWLEFTLGHYVHRHLGQSEDWIFCYAHLQRAFRYIVGHRMLFRTFCRYVNYLAITQR